MDATVIESHEREALTHYQGGRGYQPPVAVWAEQGLIVAGQYRDGNVPAGMATLEVARQAVAGLLGTVRDSFRGWRYLETPPGGPVTVAAPDELIQAGRTTPSTP